VSRQLHAKNRHVKDLIKHRWVASGGERYGPGDAVVDTLIVIAKAPRSGASKTRLCPPLAGRDACRLAQAALEDTLANVAESRAARRVLALEGEPGPWLLPGFELIAQRGDGLDARLASAFEDVGESAVLIGMDTPQLSSSAMDAAIERLSRPGTDAVLGPALDGGYWAIGLHRPRRDLIAGIPMSSAQTFSTQLQRLRSFGLNVDVLGAVADVDRIEDARLAARLAPQSRFAHTLHELCT
jgi:rSAM/selenodomain-associated transferase 1